MRMWREIWTEINGSEIQNREKERERENDREHTSMDHRYCHNP